MTATARGMLGWRHAFGDVTPTSTMAFAGGSPFTVAGVPIARNGAVADLGFDVNVTPDAVLGLTYGGQFGSGVTDQTLRGNFAVRF
ncbi:outer membrane autotransporter protein [Tardiphaga robiniae]|nr:autotransporter domain-containing protein [Tardiphaga robiniae]MDR6661536.1 outer membrane autotransporter protein [Tardiphaga robiniae]